MQNSRQQEAGGSLLWMTVIHGIGFGPADVVFPAMNRFALALQETTGLVVRFDKLSCFSYGYDLTYCEHRIRHNVPMGSVCIPASDMFPEHRANGIMVGGVPIGTSEFVAEHVRVRAEEIVGQITETISQLHSSPHHAWSTIYYCLAPLFDFTLQHVDPAVTMPHARRIDTALQNAAEECGYSGMLRDPDGSDITLRRFALPACLKGCGVRSRELLAPAAFAANLVTASTSFITTDAKQGVFDCLHPLFPPPELSGPEHGGRLAVFLASGLPAAAALDRSWAGMRAEVLASEVTGPLDRFAANAGLGCSSKLQRAITRQREQVWQQQLEQDILALAPTDPRREAFDSVDSFSYAWVASWPSVSKGWALEEREFREVMTTYLGRESPCVRALAGQVIQGNGGRRISDRFGVQLCLANLPGDGFRARHDALVDTISRDVMRAGIQGCTEPRRLFMHVLPQDPRARFANLGIIPDARFRINMEPSASRSRTQDVLFDVKTISAGGPTYAPRFRMAGGAVAERARQVPGAYVTAARRLDALHHGTVAPAVGPVLTALRAYPPVRALVFGAYGEASSDVHTLLRVAATGAASRNWAKMGARSAAEALGIFSSSLRRRWGLVAVREYARLRLNRVCYVGAAAGARAAQVSSAWLDVAGEASVFSASALWAGVRAH